MRRSSVCIACGMDNAAEFAFCWTCGRFLGAAPGVLHAASRNRRAAAAVLDLAVGLLLYEVFQFAEPPLNTAAGLAGAGYAGWSLHCMQQGQTPGKRLLRLRVIDRQGRAIGLRRYLFARTPAWWVAAGLGAVAWFASAFGGRGGVLIGPGLPDPSDGDDGTPGPLDVTQGQAMHDRMAGTYVVTYERGR